LRHAQPERLCGRQHARCGREVGVLILFLSQSSPVCTHETCYLFMCRQSLVQDKTSLFEPIAHRLPVSNDELCRIVGSCIVPGDSLKSNARGNTAQASSRDSRKTVVLDSRSFNDYFGLDGIAYINTIKPLDPLIGIAVIPL
jgi:hypothetical protein